MASGAKIAIEAMEDCLLTFLTRHIFRLYRVPYFAIAIRNLIYISVLCKSGYNVQFNGNECLIYFRNSLVVKVININGLYVLKLNDLGVMNTITNKKS